MSIEPIETGVAMPHAPAAPEAGMGIGNAQVLQGNATAGLDYALNEKRWMEQQAIAKAHRTQKAIDDIQQKVNELPMGGAIEHIPELQAAKDNIIKDITSKFIADKKYNPLMDVEQQKRISDYGAMHAANVDLKEWENKILPLADKKTQTPESLIVIDNFNKLPSLAAKQAYIKQYGLPRLEPKPDLVDWRKQAGEDYSHFGSTSYSTETPLPGSTDKTQVKSGEYVPEEKIKAHSNLVAESGILGTDAKAIALKQEAEQNLSNPKSSYYNPSYSLLAKDAANDPAKGKQQVDILKKTMIKMYDDAGRPRLSNKSKTEIQGSDKEGSGKKLTAADVHSNVPVSYFSASDGKVVSGNAQYGITLPQNVTLDVATNPHIIDSKTGLPLKGKDADGNEVPYVGQLKTTGGQIRTIGIKEGDSGKVKLRPMLFTSAMMSDGTKKDVQIPVSQIRGDKVLEESAGALDELEKKTEEWNSKSGHKEKSDARIGVKRKSDGKVGSVLEKDFDASKYEKL